MPIVIVNLPSDGTSADVADYNGPINAILAVMNGHLAADNIEPGSLDWSVMSGTMTNVIPSGAMQDSGSIEKFRAESKIGFTASGLVWSALTGLNATMTAGVQYTPDGLRRSISAVASRAFTVSKDTYISISPAGALSYQEVVNNAAWPTLGTDFCWLAKVVTSASAITSVTDMRQTSAIGSQNIDWATSMANNIKSASNTVTTNPSNGNTSLQAAGAAFQVTVSGTAYAFVSVHIGCSSTTDYEFNVLIYVDGVQVSSSGFQAALNGGASSRAQVRSNSERVLLTNGTHTISAGVALASATSPAIAIGGARIAAIILGNVIA